jgi:hypothetical protein
MIDARADLPKPPALRAFIEWTHREFCVRLPESLLTVENPDIACLRVTTCSSAPDWRSFTWRRRCASRL